MKIFKLFSLALLMSVHFIYAQKKIKKVNIYQTWVILNNESNIHGFLYQLKDSSIIVTNIKTEEAQEIEIKDIQKIKIRRKNSTGRGAVIGCASGLVVGGLIGLTEGDGFYSKEETAILTGVFFSGVGAGIGAITGTIKKKFDINGNISNYNKNIQKLRKYAIKKE